MSEHAISNAKGWLSTITGAIAAIALLEEGEEGETVAEFDGETFTYVDDVRQRIHEMPLSVLIRDGWRQPGERGEPAEFEILLSTGGPALRIYGDIGGEPFLQWQDWGTPWTTYHDTTGEEDEALRAFTNHFYFEE